MIGKLRSFGFLIAAVLIGAVLVIQYLRLLKPAQARAIQAACNGLHPSSKNESLGDLSTGIPALDFNLLDTNGNNVSLSDYQGKIVILNFWASWCTVCRSEKLSLEALQANSSRDEMVVLGIASDNDWAPVKRSMLGFEVASALEILEAPEIYGVRDAADLPATGQQVVISRVDRGRSAQKSGIRWLSRILSVNNTPIENKEDLDAVLRQAGSTWTMKVNHKGTTQTHVLTEDSAIKILLDPSDDAGNLGSVAKRYGITKVPESFIIDRSGTIRHYLVNKRNWNGDVAETCLQDLIDN